MTGNEGIKTLADLPMNAQMYVFINGEKIPVVGMECDHWEGPLAPIFLTLAREPKAAFGPGDVSDDDVIRALGTRLTDCTAEEAEFGKIFDRMAVEVPV